MHAEEEPKSIWKRTCQLGIIFVIVGYVSFSNYERVGDILQVLGALMILMSKYMKWKERRSLEVI